MITRDTAGQLRCTSRRQVWSCESLQLVAEKNFTTKYCSVLTRAAKWTRWMSVMMLVSLDENKLSVKAANCGCQMLLIRRTYDPARHHKFAWPWPCYHHSTCPRKTYYSKGGSVMLSIASKHILDNEALLAVNFLNYTNYRCLKLGIMNNTFIFVDNPVTVRSPSSNETGSLNWYIVIFRHRIKQYPEEIINFHSMDWSSFKAVKQSPHKAPKIVSQKIVYTILYSHHSENIGVKRIFRRIYKRTPVL